jgi:hypothetical protein
MRYMKSGLLRLLICEDTAIVNVSAVTDTSFWDRILQQQIAKNKTGLIKRRKTWLTDWIAFWNPFKPGQRRKKPKKTCRQGNTRGQSSIKLTVQWDILVEDKVLVQRVVEHCIDFA